MDFKINPEIELARNFLSFTSANIFLTGKAGTGKTTFLNEVARNVGKRTVVAAPTGIAALNAQGVTLHSLFLLPFAPYLPSSRGNTKPQRFNKAKRRLLQTMELLIIDEISMVRADVLDAIDNTLRRVRRVQRPFGGVQLLLIGDVQQLAPVCRDDDWIQLKEYYDAPFFFEARAFKSCDFITVELKEIFRQRDLEFTDMLNSIRENRITSQTVAKFNTRHIPNFEPEDGYITLTTHRYSADQINIQKLAQIDRRSRVYTAQIEGDFPESSYPTVENLELKVGAQVIFLKNGMAGEVNYYNGMMGYVSSMGTDGVRVELKDDPMVELEIEVAKWDNVEYVLDEESGEFREHVKGTFSQIPLCCAWAITIHKSQGLSFDKVVIDVDRAFAHGQAYVAFSRCRTLEGLVLSAPFSPRAVIQSCSVNDFGHYIEEHASSEQKLQLRQRQYFGELLQEIYNFEYFYNALCDLRGQFSASLSKSYPQLFLKVHELQPEFRQQVVDVGEKFCRQIGSIVASSEDYVNDPKLKERLSKGAGYFLEKMGDIALVLKQLRQVSSDSKELQTKLVALRTELRDQLMVKGCSLRMCGSEQGFDIDIYRNIKAGIENPFSEPKEQKVAEPKQLRATIDQEHADIEHPELYEQLVKWRLEQAEKIERRAFHVMSNKVLIAITDAMPTELDELSEVKGIGRQKLEEYGEMILEIVRAYNGL